MTGITDELRAAWDAFARLVNVLMPAAASDVWRVKGLFGDL